MKRTLLILGSKYFLAACGFALILFTFASLSAPDLPEEPAEVDKDSLARAKRNREMKIDRENPLVLYREVDYSKGKSAEWYPKGEAPILRELVENGDLPPVAERVGEEPCVMEGPEGIGKYGGIWHRVGGPTEVNIISYRLSYCTYLRFSPQGFPIVPNIAKSVVPNEDNTEFVITLRKGMKWSDGHPFTTDDVMFRWAHLNDEEATPNGPWDIWKVNGRLCEVEQLDKYRYRITFPEPNGVFMATMAGGRGNRLVGDPAHYLRQYHPTMGDPAVIEQHMSERKIGTKNAAFLDAANTLNPLCPKLWPWVYRRYSETPPQRAIRNPYYWMVDSQGNQLPYIDEILFKDVDARMQPNACANGEVSMQRRGINFKDYTLLMGNREEKGYDVYHWHSGSRSWYCLFVNLTRRIEEDKPETTYKAELLSDKRFRQALSLALDRDTMIEAEYNGLTEPANDLPGPASLFYDPESHTKYCRYDPAEANRLLDELGLTHRDSEGYRTFNDPDHTRMTFFVSYTQWTGIGPGQFVVDDWADVGIRAVLRERSRTLFQAEKTASVHDFIVFEGYGHYYPMVGMPVHMNGAYGYEQWYNLGGLYSDENVKDSNLAVEPPPGSPVRRYLELFAAASAPSDVREQAEIYREAQRIAAEEQWNINICTPPPILAVVQDGFRNVPRKVVAGFAFHTPSNGGVEAFYFEDPYANLSEDEYRDVAKRMKDDITKGELADDWPDPAKVRTVELAEADVEAEEIAEPEAAAPEESFAEVAGRLLGSVIRWTVVLILLALVAMIVLRHPYIGRRLLIMIPTLMIVSIVVFVVIQLPPGNFLDNRIIQLQEQGDRISQQELENTRKMFWLDEPVYVRYIKWLGLYWFVSYDSADTGLLQGNMGRSMEPPHAQVNQLVGDRILLTMMISAGTIIFTYCLSLPIGIYSAVRQYSISDYVLTTLGFIGLCVPNFLLALLLMYASDQWFGITISGLFSPEYASQIGWSMGKVVDLLKHIWLPIVILGVTGTAGGIRTMRANLLDELKKPYVVTARAKGVKPLKLLIKYPVRLALNPFVSGIGNIFPRLVSGGAIIGIIMSLPTVGPLMLQALMSQDMYFAGSMLMVLSLLTVFGTLVSDLLLLTLDPRIRFQGGTR